MVAFYRLFAWHATPKVYQTPKPVPVLCSLGVALFFSGSLSNLLDIIGLPAKHILFCYLLLHNRPSLGQQLFFQANHEHFYFLSADLYYYDDIHPEHG